MGVLYFIRHGQASFAGDNYDRLSNTGRDQAALTGVFLAEAGLRFDTVFSGPLERQTETARLVLERMGHGGPEPTLLEGLREYNSDAIFKQLLPMMIAEDPKLAAMAEKLFEDRRSFQLVFEKVMDRWMAGTGDADGLETWAGFYGRVEKDLHSAIEHMGRGKTAAFFTSGGPIGVAVCLALGLDGERFLGLNWQIRNASITTLLYGGGRIALSSFNSTAHLERLGRPELITYR